MAEKLKVTLVKSTIGAIPKHRATVEALGLKKLNKTVERQEHHGRKGIFPLHESDRRIFPDYVLEKHEIHSVADL